MERWERNAPLKPGILVLPDKGSARRFKTTGRPSLCSNDVETFRWSRPVHGWLHRVFPLRPWLAWVSTSDRSTKSVTVCGGWGRGGRCERCVRTRIVMEGWLSKSYRVSQQRSFNSPRLLSGFFFWGVRSVWRPTDPSSHNMDPYISGAVGKPSTILLPTDYPESLDRDATRARALGKAPKAPGEAPPRIGERGGKIVRFMRAASYYTHAWQWAKMNYYSRIRSWTEFSQNSIALDVKITPLYHLRIERKRPGNFPRWNLFGERGNFFPDPVSRGPPRETLPPRVTLT